VAPQSLLPQLRSLFLYSLGDQVRKNPSAKLEHLKNEVEDFHPLLKELLPKLPDIKLVE
jgi:hypothetical protein